MGYAAKAMKKIHENTDLGKIDDLMADITEQQDVAQEISDAISRPFGETFDEDELLAELEELEQEDIDESIGELPSVPSSKLPSSRSNERATTRRKVEEEDDMRMLASWGT
ncbi:unnamed protein product [Oreochromis niloticus]|nr:unnamed protein product [Mustela putorius furo]